MNTKTLWAGLAVAVFTSGAQATAIAFQDVTYELAAIALTADGEPGIDLQAGGLGGDSFAASAASVGASDVATAGAFVAPGLLGTAADASALGFGSAVATARFIGSFVNPGTVNLSVDFGSFDSGIGSGLAQTTLFVSLVSDGITLFADFVGPGTWTASYNPLRGSTTVLDLLLASDASAAFTSAEPGNASAFGLVAITAAVPEASTWALFALGLGGLGAVRARRQRLPAMQTT